MDSLIIAKYASCAALRGISSPPKAATPATVTKQNACLKMKEWINAS